MGLLGPEMILISFGYPPSEMSVPQAENQVHLKYTEAEMDCTIEKEETDERGKVQLEYAGELAVLNKEFAEIKNKYVVSRKEDMQGVVESNFQSDSCLNEFELLQYRNLLSEFDEFETGVIECHKQLKQQSECAENGNKVNTHDSLQSLNSSFEDLQQRYKQLSEDSARKIHALEESLQLKSKLEEVNKQLQAIVQSDLQDMKHFAHEANLQYSSLQRKLSSDLAVEKATAKRVEVEVASLEKSVHQMELEKLQLQQFCEDLMKELGSH